MRFRPAACTVEDSPRQPSTSRIVPNVIFNLCIFDFPFLFLAFFSFSPCRLRPALAGYGVPRRNQFWPFTGVLRGIGGVVTHKLCESLNPPARKNSKLKGESLSQGNQEC